MEFASLIRQANREGRAPAYHLDEWSFRAENGKLVVLCHGKKRDTLFPSEVEDFQVWCDSMGPESGLNQVRHMRWKTAKGIEFEMALNQRRNMGL